MSYTTATGYIRLGSAYMTHQVDTGVTKTHSSKIGYECHTYLVGLEHIQARTSFESSPRIGNINEIKSPSSK